MQGLDNFVLDIKRANITILTYLDNADHVCNLVPHKLYYFLLVVSFFAQINYFFITFVELIKLLSNTNFLCFYTNRLQIKITAFQG